MDKHKNHHEQFKLISEKMITLGEASMEIGVYEADELLATKGNILQLVGGILSSESESNIKEFEAYISYFSAKKIVEEISPSNLSIAQKLSTREGGFPSFDEFRDMLDGLPGGPYIFDKNNLPEVPGISDFIDMLTNQISGGDMDKRVDDEIDNILENYSDDDGDDDDDE